MTLQALLDNGDQVLIIPAADYPLWIWRRPHMVAIPWHYLCDETQGWNLISPT